MQFKSTGVMACLLMAGPFAIANATEVTWDINATFVNGGGISGSFVMDTTTPEGVSENITITSLAASVPGAIFVGGIDSLAANTLGGSGSLYTSGPNSGGGGSDLVVFLPSSTWFTSTVVGTEFAIAPGVGSCSPSTGLCDNFGGSYYGNFEADVVDVQSGQLTLVNVTPVPIGAAGSLMLSGLGVLGVFARKRTAA